MNTYDCGALLGETLFELLDEFCDNLVEFLLRNSEDLFEVLDLGKEILRHIGHGT